MLSPMTSITLAIDHLTATDAFGCRLGELLFPGAVIALVGPLGAGKTHLVRAIATGLGIANPGAVTSPTFVLIQEYPAARLPIFHFDAYRLSGPSEFLELGVYEYYEMRGVCLVEWADRIETALPDEHLRIEILPIDADRRQFRITARGERYTELLLNLQRDLSPHPEPP
jgi:tRNA threonylcarbamoyladenosine biosynthesis protein TsaE